MIRTYLIGGALAAIAFGWGLYLWEARKHADTRAALDLATSYVAATKETTNALSDLPVDPDGVLAELCRIAPGGEGCGDTRSSPAGGDGTRDGFDIQ